MFKFINFSKTLIKFVRHNSSKTIFALSSGHGKCGVAVIRVSGSHTQTALKCVGGLLKLPQPRTAVLRSIKDPVTQDVLDKGLILWFPGPHSFTGEDCCEFHVHGGLAVVNAVLNALSSISKLRLAEPGEFTKRAFMNGKLDLTEVEGLADLLQAETEAQRKQAFLQTQGSLSKLYNNWSQILVKSLAHIEAYIDFEETETLEEDILNLVSGNIMKLCKEIKQHLDDGRKGELLRSGVKTVILGEPNVGKSSLLNLLIKRPAAIVTPIEGTTRDVLEVRLNIGGYPLILADTAGLRSKTDDVIEKEGITRAIETYENCDLVILVIDSFKYYHWLNCNRDKNISEYIKYYIQVLGLNNFIDTENMFMKPCLVIFNKIDLIKQVNFKSDERIICISCKNKEGVQEFVQKLTEKLKTLCGEPSVEHPSMNQVRHRQHLTNCLNCLHLSLKNSSDAVLMAEYLRKSLKHLGYLVGTTTTEQLLDVIFKDFCIGK